MSAADTSGPTRTPYRPSWAQRQANTMLTRALRNGRGPSFMRLLTVRGRTTGTARATPVVPVHEGDRTWVVSPFGDVAWVLDARATGRVELHRGDQHDTYTIRELNVVNAVPVLRRYLGTPARFFVRRHFAVAATSADTAIAADADRHPVFELTPVQ